MKLVSMIDRVDNLKCGLQPFEEVDVFTWHNLIKQYANFLNQPLNLGMFVPAIEVKGKWVVLEHPDNMVFIDVMQQSEYLKQYQLAKDKTLFKGFDSVRYVNEIIIIKHKSYVGKFHISCKVYNLIELKFLTLTAKGLNDSGLK